MNFDRVHQDVAAGRAWKALDRLEGMRSTAPADQELLELLGRLRFDLGDHPHAGLAWFLTAAGGGPDRAVALAAMRERYGSHADGLLWTLKAIGPLADYPPAVQERLRELGWEPRHGRRSAGRRDDIQSSRPVELLACLGISAVMALPWVVGVVVLVKLLVD